MVLALVALMATSSGADAPPEDDAGSEEPAQARNPLVLTLSPIVQWLAGNTASLLLGGRVEVGFDVPAHRLTVGVGGAFGQAASTDGWEITSRNLVGDARWLARLSDSGDGLLVTAAARHDPLAGFSARVGGGVGWTRQLLDTQVTRLGIGLGGAYAWELYTPELGDPGHFVGADLGIDLGVVAGDTLGFREVLSFQPGALIREGTGSFDGYIDSTTTVSVRLSKKIALELGHRLKVDLVPPAGKKPVDSGLMVGVAACIGPH